MIGRRSAAGSGCADHGKWCFSLLYRAGSALSATGCKRPDIGTAGSRVYQMTDLAKRFIKAESGATAIEYGLIAAGISIAIIVVVNSLGSQLKTTFTKVTSQLATAGRSTQ